MEVKVLNLFAYTGGATVAAAQAGAVVTHVDASKGMVGWAKENAEASGIGHSSVRWLVDDCRKFVEREIRRGNHYDAIIMDPPSYGRGPKGEIWKMEDCIHELLKLTTQLLSKKAAVLPAEFLYDGPVPGSADVSFERDARSHLRGNRFIGGDRTSGQRQRPDSALRGSRALGTVTRLYSKPDDT